MPNPPFGGRPTLDLVAVHLAPGGTLVLVHREPGGIALLQVDPISGQRVVLASGLSGPAAAQPTGPGGYPDLITASPAASRLLVPATQGYAAGFDLPAAFPLVRSVRRTTDGIRLISVALLPGAEVSLVVPFPWSAYVFRTTPLQTALWTHGGGLLLTAPTTTGIVSDYYGVGAPQRIGMPSPVTLLLNHAAR